MSTLAERIAAKKKAAEAGSSAVIEEAKKAVAETVSTPVQPAPNIVAATVVQKSAEELAKEMVALTDANGKPLSGFALIKARKELAAKLAAMPKVEQKVEDAGKESDNSAGSGSEQVGNGALAEQSATQAEIANLSTSEEPSGDAEEVTEEGNGSEEESEAYRSATPEARQAYADIKPRIDSLVALTGEDIKGAMQELKKALMQNPNAVALMLPSDIGQMVIALRKMTGVELAVAKSNGTGKTKKVKEIALTAEQLEDAWKEL